MELSLAFAIIALAALIHASFQLSISVLTLLSGHAIGAKRSQAAVFRLTTSFVIGAGVMTILLLSFIALILLHTVTTDSLQLVWTIACGLLFGVGVAVWFFYYQHDRGTTLWVPRGLAAFLADRSKATKRSAEAFGLGLASVFGELLFIIAPLTVAALVLISLPPLWQLAGIAFYGAVSLFSLGIVWMLVGGGHKLSRIQKWREQHKYFLQFSAASGLIILSFFVYVNEVFATMTGAL